MKSLAELESEIAKTKDYRSTLFEKRAPIDEALTTSYQDLVKLLEARDTILIKEKADDWAWILSYEEGDTSQLKYRFSHDKLHEIGFYASGHTEATNQMFLKMVLTYGNQESYDKVVAGIKLILPYLKPVDGKKKIGIFDSAGSSLYLTFGEGEIAIGVHHRPVIQTFANIEAAVKYVQINHPFDGHPCDDESDYDD